MLSGLIVGITRNFALRAKPRVAVKSANLTDNIDRYVGIQPKPGVDLRQPAVSEQETGGDLEQERGQSNPFKPLFEVKYNGRVALAQRPRKNGCRQHQVTPDPNRGSHEMKRN